MKSISLLLCACLALSGCAVPVYTAPSKTRYVYTEVVYGTPQVRINPIETPPEVMQRLEEAERRHGPVRQVFRPVPLSRLANYSSLRKKMTQAEFKQAYDIALEIVTPLAGLPVERQLIGIAEALRKRFDAMGTYSTSKRHYNDPYGYFVLGVASCAGCTRATGLCLNILGIPYQHINENQWAHQWCRVNVNGTYWICDAFGLYAGPEPGPYRHPRWPGR